MGDRIKQLRIDKGLTQEELGNYIGVQKSAIRKYEKGEITNIKRSAIEIMAKLFNVSPSYLMCLEEELEPIQAIELNILGKISAGLPLFAEEQLDGKAFAPANLLKKGFDYFYLRVVGDSMNLKFHEGDIVLIQKQDTLENNEIGVIRVNGYDATIKQYRFENGLIMLDPMSTNPEHKTQVYNPAEVEIKIIGKAISYQGLV
jgi:repressor LexA